MESIFWLLFQDGTMRMLGVLRRCHSTLHCENQLSQSFRTLNALLIRSLTVLQNSLMVPMVVGRR